MVISTRIDPLGNLVQQGCRIYIILVYYNASQSRGTNKNGGENEWVDGWM